MNMPGRSSSMGGKYRYGFNGKENDNSTGEGNLDYGARVYDAKIGRWFACDPKDKAWISPYNFVSNSPPNKIDPDGKG
jgi:RHS repeat-associated protein